jgi:hypothetical protein
MPGGLSDWASPFNNEDTIQTTNNAIQNRKNDRNRRNSTIKKKFTCPKQVESFMNLQNSLCGSDDDEDCLANFEPLDAPRLTKPSKNDKKNNLNKTDATPNTPIKPTEDSVITPTSFEAQSPESYQNYIPYVNQQSNSGMLQHNDTIMLEKINYMIHLLEDQKDEKTGHVAEELILYTFLGVFVIFVLDSFVKTGKYSR